MRGKTPESVYSDMMRNNPQFAKFAQDCQGKSVGQILSEYGIDPKILG